jgi:hypothetical protein
VAKTLPARRRLFAAHENGVPNLRQHWLRRRSCDQLNRRFEFRPGGRL